MTKSKVSLHDHNSYIDSLKNRTMKHNNVILRA